MHNQVTLDNLQEIARELRSFFKIGNIISINGPIGIGKTTLLKEILSEYDVSSPSFLHALSYGEDFMHIDAYTLTEDRLIDLSIEDFLESHCIIIEWGNLYKEFLQKFDANLIQIDLKYENNLRIIDCSSMN